MKDLTDQQRIFVEEYTADRSLNGAKAARAAKYAVPDVAAARLLGNPKVRAVLCSIIEADLEDVGVKREDVLRELAFLAFSNVKDLFDPETGEVIAPHELPDHVAASISEVLIDETEDEDGNIKRKIKYKQHSKSHALELWAKRFQLLVERLDITVHSEEEMLDQLIKRVEGRVLPATFIKE